MKTYDVQEVESNCLEIVDEVYETGESVLITKEGEPHVMMRPFDEED